MKKLVKWLIWLTVTMAVLVTLLVFNPGLVKGPVESYLGGVTGYSIRLNGDLEVDIGGLLVLSANDVSVAALTETDQPDLLELDRLTLSLVTLSLFKDIIVLENLHLAGLQLNIATDANGQGNWQVPGEPETPMEPKGEGKKIVIKDIRVSGSEIRYHNGGKNLNHLLQVDTFSQNQNPDGILHSSFDGQFNGRKVFFTGDFGPYDNILAGQNIRFDASGRLGELAINGKGLIDNILKPGRPVFNINLEGPDIDEITAMLGIDDLGGGGFSLNATGGVIQDRYEAAVNGKIGDISLDMSAKATDLSELDRLDLELAAFGPSLGAFTRAFGIEHWPDKPFNIQADVERVGRTLNIPSLNLNIGGTHMSLDALLTNFPGLNASKVKLKISGDDVKQFHELLGISGPGVGAFELNGRLDISINGVELVNVDLKSSMGTASLSGSLGPAPDYVGSKLSIHLDGKSANRLVAAFGVDALPDLPFSLNAGAELLDNAVRIENGVLVTSLDDRIELGGMIKFEPGLKGSDFKLKASGQNLSRVLQELLGSTTIPAQPYQLSSNVRILENGIRLTGAEAVYNGISLKTDGLVSFDEQLLGSHLDVDIRHDNLSDLSAFSFIGNSLDMLYPGQALQASGQVSAAREGWKLSGIKGRLGTTDLGVDVLISHGGNLTGSSINFQLQGTDTHRLLTGKTANMLAPGPFSAKGQLNLDESSLHIRSVEINTTRSHGSVDLKLGWPISDVLNIDFNIDLQGEDISTLIPPVQSFEITPAAFKLDTLGAIRDNLISLERFEATVGDLVINITGDVDDGASSTDANIRIGAVSSDISSLGQINGQPLPAIPLDIQSGFVGNARDFALRNFSASLGNSRVNAALDVSISGPKPIIKITAQSDLIDISPFQSAEVPDKTKTDKKTKKDRLIPAIELPLSFLEMADIDINLDVKELKHRKDSLRNLRVDTQIQSGAMRIEELSFNAPKGQIKSSFSIQPTKEGAADVRLDLTATEIYFNLSGLPKDKLGEVPRFDIEAHVSGTGRDTRELAASSNGFATMKSTGGMMEGIDLSILDTFILDEIFSLIMPKSKDPGNTRLNCAAAFLDIENGLMTTAPALAFTTDKITIITNGTLDFKTEKMHFNFNATPNNALKISAGELFNSFILISGTLARPSVGLDPGKTLIHGGAAIGTAGISLLAKGLLDRVSNTRPLCEEMLNTAFKPKARG